MVLILRFQYYAYAHPAQYIQPHHAVKVSPLLRVDFFMLIPCSWTDKGISQELTQLRLKTEQEVSTRKSCRLHNNVYSAVDKDV